MRDSAGFPQAEHGGPGSREAVAEQLTTAGNYSPFNGTPRDRAYSRAFACSSGGNPAISASIIREAVALFIETLEEDKLPVPPEKFETYVVAV